MPGFSNRLARIRNNKSQTEFADFLGIKQTHISRYENDKAKPGYDFLKILAEKTKVNLCWLLTGEGNMYISDQPESELMSRVRELESELDRLNTVLNQVSNLSSNTEAKVIKNGHRKKNLYKTLNSNGIINYSLN